MMTKDLTTNEQSKAIRFVPEGETGNRRSRLQEFADWLHNTGRTWASPDLAAYQEYLLTRDETRTVETRTGKTTTRRYGPVAPGSIVSYVATVRGRYRDLLKEDATRDALYTLAGQQLAELGQADSPANRKAFVDEAIERLGNGTAPSDRDVKPITHQDRTDEEVGIRLTRAQADALLASPGLIPIDKLRDTAILAVFLCTGLREQELADLHVKDLRERLDGELCVKVRMGKGKKARCVPWGAGEWALHYVDKWLAAAGIKEGAVFCGFYKPRADGSRKLRPGRLTTRALQMIVGAYPVSIDGELVTLAPHDLRRTYARACYDAGMDILSIQQNLGHADHKVTIRYIGLTDADGRKPPALYTPPYWADLGKLPTQGVIDGGH